ncbi:MAG: YraN family protein [Bacteroidales bacterium]|nr:YraN family protein [Bacteroidales bacterium]MDD3100537.1 YraN family protein [Bacteroidales bacterium]MDD3639448.1 YraN family protein [Bacteroidales bacterium]MDD4480734.1 YraN family protein [Bacteroidales bacterium]MDD5714128.1 YraN family protein [Bacteroidales bacterium]
MNLPTFVIREKHMEGRKRNTLLTGRKGEELAIHFLKQKGFTILDTNWRAGHKELDIVARREERIHFVEVRSRSATAVVAPEATIDRSKQRKVMAAARAYMAKYRITEEVRFDVIAIVFGPGGIYVPDYDLEYIPDAFTLFL